jgi:hypothetical protein
VPDRLEFPGDVEPVAREREVWFGPGLGSHATGIVSRAALLATQVRVAYGSKVTVALRLRDGRSAPTNGRLFHGSFHRTSASASALLASFVSGSTPSNRHNSR